MRRKISFFIQVGIANKDLGPSLKKDAVKFARGERKAAAEKDYQVALFKRTKHGAVSVPF